MTKERLEEVLNNILDWAVDHDDEFVECLIYAADFTSEELRELDLYDYAQDDDEDDEDDYQDQDLDDLSNELDKSFTSATLYDGDPAYVEVRYLEEVEPVEQLIKDMGFEIDEESTRWCRVNNNDVYCIFILK